MGEDQNGDTKNNPENLFDRAMKNLIKKAVFDDSIKNEFLDALGIDRVIIKMTPNTDNDRKQNKVRLCLHLQIKKDKDGVIKHQNKYPAIPAIYFNLKSPVKIEIIEEEIIFFFLKHFEKSCYYDTIFSDIFEKYYGIPNN